MNKSKLLSILKSCGLSENEAAVYLASLSLGAATVLDISNKAQLKRTTIYAIIESLQEQGLIKAEVHGFKRKFVASAPAQLELLLFERQERVRKILPELESIRNFKTEDHAVRYYEGQGNIRSIYNDLIKSVRPGDFYLITANIDKFVEQDPEFYKDFFQRRAAIFKKLPPPGIDLRLLMTDTPQARARKNIDRQYAETIKILPASIKLSTNCVVIPKRLVLHQTVPPIFAVVIENYSLIEMQRQMFEMLWATIP